MSSRSPIRRALVSVYDKTGLTGLAQVLHQAGVEIVSTGSTAAAITGAGLPVTPVEEVTGFPEILDGRVKTLHPAVHAGLLADLSQPSHQARLEELGIAPFGLLVSNLYPFEAVAVSGAPPAECIEQIDVGGPAMVRAAAKNHSQVAVITDPSMYDAVAEAVAAGGFTLEQRRRLAARAFAHTAAYDCAVATWFAADYAPDETAQETGWPAVTGALWTRREVLRYGENPHQKAALYERAGAGSDDGPGPGSTTTSGHPGISGAQQLHGKAMSYNNYVDAAAAWRAAHDFAEPCVAIIKHSNPCGIARGVDIADAHRKANACDPVSAFGGVIAANRVVTEAMARQVADIFTEVLVAPGFEEGALEVLTGRKNLRLLTIPPPAKGVGGAAERPAPGEGAVAGERPAPGEGAVPPGEGAARAERAAIDQAEWRQVDGGMLLQTPDRVDAAGDDPANWELKAGKPAAAEVLADLAFAWRACRAVKSNAILLASGGATVGVGMGQVNRVDAARLAVARADDRAAGAVAASDAYFPFPDGLEVLARAGVQAIVEPGGSVRDEQVIAAAAQAGITLYFTGVRHFFH
ncbi:MAG TPA: bifunctional phosphoribosylaminoimidazolecarboxamide formyltransferase/IMP cyclohydrolase [Streptosporangiaceae bacterium]|nr:bifunctional phosphoribosylaminoimidazolecarboxamide formyltransferase/IMP cyclohydrolase [Streptosporangiaceae bacterium]